MPLSFELLETIIVGFINNDRFWSIAILLLYHSYLEKWTISCIVSENKALHFMKCENTVYMHGIWRNCGRDNESIIQKLIEDDCHNKAFEEYNRVNSNYLVIKKIKVTNNSLIELNLILLRCACEWNYNITFLTTNELFNEYFYSIWHYILVFQFKMIFFFYQISHSENQLQRGTTKKHFELFMCYKKLKS